RPGRRRPVEPGDRRSVVHQHRHREDARQPGHDEDRQQRPGAAGGLRLRDRADRAALGPRRRAMTGAAAGRVRGTDALLALLAILIAMAELAYSRQHALRAPTMPQLALMVTGAGALILRRRHPRAVAAVAVLCGTAFPFAAPHDV